MLGVKEVIEEDKKPPRRVGVDSDDSISFDIQFEYEKILADVRIEKDPSIIKNGLFDVIIKLASIISLRSDDQDIKDAVKREMDLLDSDELSPKTKIKYLFDEYHLKYDSYSVKCGPTELEVTLNQLDREREQVTIRRLWVMLGRLQIIAYAENIFKESYTLRGDVKHVR